MDLHSGLKIYQPLPLSEHIIYPNWAFWFENILSGNPVLGPALSLMFHPFSLFILLLSVRKERQTSKWSPFSETNVHGFQSQSEEEEKKLWATCSTFLRAKFHSPKELFYRGAWPEHSIVSCDRLRNARAWVRSPHYDGRSRMPDFSWHDKWS
jgi:hypothetical protein